MEEEIHILEGCFYALEEVNPTSEEDFKSKGEKS